MTASKTRHRLRATPLGEVLAIKPGELTHIDFTRFVAAIGIMLAHSLELFFPVAERARSHGYTAGLTLFVDVFFVLSGYVIAHIYAGRLNTLADFGRYMQKRVARLVPLHWATLLAATVLYAGLTRAGVPLNTRPDLSAGCIASAAVLVHSWIDCGGIPPNAASWSISAEMVMYAAFPAIAVLLSLPRPARIAVAVLVLGACAWIGGGLAPMSGAWSPVRAAPAFVLGVLLYGERGTLTMGLPSSAPLVAALLLVIGSVLEVPRAALLGLAYATAACAIIADQGTAPNRLVQRIAPLGQLTYSIYMLHGLIITVTANAIGDKFLHLPPLGMALSTVAAWALVLIASALSYAWFEQPSRAAIGAFGTSARKHPTPA